MAFDSKQQREIMGRFATGVTVIGTPAPGEGDGTYGMTANAVTSLSLDPPLVLVCVQKGNQMHGHLSGSRCFSMCILSEEQQDVSDRFAFKGPKDFSGLETTTAETGAPILPDVLGWVDCRLLDTLAGGDHDIFIGEIVAGECRDGRPLLYAVGGYARLADEDR